jgi:hypothetical protein
MPGGLLFVRKILVERVMTASTLSFAHGSIRFAGRREVDCAGAVAGNTVPWIKTPRLF